MSERVIGKHPSWKIIDGDALSAQDYTIEARKSFVDEVMIRIEDIAPFEIIDGGRTADKSVQGSSAKIEYVGPKRLPRIVVVEKTSKSQSPQKLCKVINFFRGGHNAQ